MTGFDTESALPNFVSVVTKKDLIMRILVSMLMLLFFSACAFSSGQSMPYDMTLVNMGYQELVKENYTEAEAFFDVARSVNPENPYVLINLGVVYQNTDRVEEAKEMYRKVIAMHPDYLANQSTDTQYKGKTLAEIAQTNLRSLEP
jgi:tetratricopeptide (TPR) repeat protein